MAASTSPIGHLPHNDSARIAVASNDHLSCYTPNTLLSREWSRPYSHQLVFHVNWSLRDFLAVMANDLTDLLPLDSRKIFGMGSNGCSKLLEVGLVRSC